MIPNGALRRFISSTAQGKGLSERAFIARIHAKLGIQRMPDMVIKRHSGALRKVAPNRPMQPDEEVFEWKSESDAVFEYLRKNFEKIKIDEI